MSALDRLRDLVFPGSELRPDPLWFGSHNEMLGKYALYDRYVTGDVFNTPADPEAAEDGGLKYPLKINLCREWAKMMSGYLYGQYGDTIVTHTARRKTKRDGDTSTEEEKRAAEMENVLIDQWLLNNNNSLGMTAAMDAAVYGGVVIKTVYDSVDNRVRDEWITPDIFIPRWYPTDVNRLLEVFQAYSITKDDARDIYNLSKEQWSRLPFEVLVWERWKKDERELWVEDIPIIRGKNQFGYVPYTYIPWDRSSSINSGYYGISTLEDMMGVQDELNERMADLGDGVAYSSHPIRVVRNVTSRQDLDVGPDALWDLGMGFGNRQPDAFTLDVNSNYGDMMKFMSSLEKYGRESVGLPPIAFGEDDGSQRSGTTLLIRFLPLTQQIRRARLYWQAGLYQRALKVLDLTARFGDEKPGYSVSDLKNRIIDVNMAPILPKDVSDKVDEWAVRIGSGFGTPEEAYEDLGSPEPAKAAEKALEYMERVAKMENQLKGVQNVGRPASDGSGNQSQGGSSAGQVQKGAQKGQSGQRTARSKAE